MIKVSSDRTRGAEYFEPIITHRTQSAALELFVIYELGYGGQVVGLADVVGGVEIQTVTRVMGCFDKTIFTGSKEEMTPFLDFTGVYSKVSEIKEVKEKNMDDVFRITKGIPLMVKLGGDFLMGSGSIQATIYSLILMEYFKEAEPSQDQVKELMDKLANVKSKEKLKDMLAAWVMMRYENQNPSEVIELLA